MDRHAQIDEFSLAAHRVAVQRLRDQPERLREALQVIERWRRQAGGPTHSDAYWDEWERALHQGVEAVEGIALDPSSHGQTLRSVSPLGRLIDPRERTALLRTVRTET